SNTSTETAEDRVRYEKLRNYGKFYDKGNKALRGKKYQEAEKHFLKALEWWPHNPDAWLNFTYVLNVQKKYADTVSYLEDAAQKSYIYNGLPNSLKQNYAVALYNVGRDIDALDIFEEIEEALSAPYFLYPHNVFNPDLQGMEKDQDLKRVQEVLEYLQPIV